jgi:hypothetical protein
VHFAACDPTCDGVGYFVQKGGKKAEWIAEQCVVEYEDYEYVGCVEDEEGDLGFVHFCESVLMIADIRLIG